MESTELFDTEPRIRTIEELGVEARLDRVEWRLRRMCDELHVCFRAVQALLVAQHQKETAEQLGREFAALHQTPLSERDTLPPEAT